VKKTAEKTAVELPPIIVKSKESSSEAKKVAVNRPVIPLRKRLGIGKDKAKNTVRNSSSKLQGRIITVNDTHNFVVIDLGENDGVKSGMSFNVYRDKETIGKIEIIETREKIAAADIVELITEQDLKSDDVVRLSAR
jgi:hypothetical protein